MVNDENRKSSSSSSQSRRNRTLALYGTNGVSESRRQRRALRPPSLRPTEFRVSFQGQTFCFKRRLSQPIIPEISPEVRSRIYEGHSPALSVPQIRTQLASLGQQLYNFKRFCRVDLQALMAATESSNADPTEIPVTIDSEAHLERNLLPSHVAIVGHATYPVHGVILAANCSNITFESTSSNDTSLPAMHLFLSDPTQFREILYYLYTKDKDIFFRHPFLPSNVNASTFMDSHYNTKARTSFGMNLGVACTVEQLLVSLDAVEGLKQNVLDLGFVDKDIWTVVESLREVHIIGLAYRTRAFEHI